MQGERLRARPGFPQGPQEQHLRQVAEHGFVDIVVDGVEKRIGVTRRIIKRDLAAAYAELRLRLEPELAFAAKSTARKAT